VPDRDAPRIGVPGFIEADDGPEIGAAVPGHYGPAPGGVTLAETTFATAWNVQGDADLFLFAETARQVLGLALPTVPNTTAREGTLTALWLGPTSWLLVAADGAALSDFAATRAKLNDARGALFDIGASCVAWTVAGPRSATLLAKGCPLDFHPRSFAEGACAQSMFGHVNTLFYRRDASTFTLIVGRSYARSLWRTLCAAAAQYGYDVLPARSF
jgi:sarcosine oxidase subunit gamma